MSSFMKKAYDSTKGRGSADVSDNLRKQERQAAQTYRQFGGTGPAPGFSTRDREDALNEYGIQDEQRREEAAGSLFDLASTIDERKGTVSDIISDSQDSLAAANRTAAQSQNNQTREHQLTLNETQTDTENKLNQINWNEYKSQTDRNDLIDEAYEKGALEELTFQNAVEGKLRMQDIDYYYAKLKQDLQNAYDAWKLGKELEWKRYLERVETNAQNTGAIIQGITEITIEGVTS